MRASKQISIAAGDDDASVLRICELPATAIVDSIDLEAGAVTGMDDVDIGLYNPDGSEADKDCFLDGEDLSSVTGLPLGPFGVALRRCMKALDNDEHLKAVWQHAGHVNKANPGAGEVNRKGKYILAVTFNTIGSGTGDLLFTVNYRTPI
jgi:hypothetical protein